MIVLTPTTTPELLAVAKADAARQGLSLKNVTDLLESIYTSSFRSGSISVDVPLAVDEDGDTYEGIHLVLSRRFKKNGTRYIGDGDILINFDVFADTFKSIYS